MNNQKTANAGRGLKQKIGLWAGPLVGLLILLFADLQPDNLVVTYFSAVAAGH